jgi:hypothetical protein
VTSPTAGPCPPRSATPSTHPAPPASPLPAPTCQRSAAPGTARRPRREPGGRARPRSGARGARHGPTRGQSAEYARVATRHERPSVLDGVGEARRRGTCLCGARAGSRLGYLPSGATDHRDPDHGGQRAARRAGAARRGEAGRGQPVMASLGTARCLLCSAAGGWSPFPGSRWWCLVGGELGTDLFENRYGFVGIGARNFVECVFAECGDQ